MNSIYLERKEDINNTSGTGRVWDGVEFSNGWVAGIWNSECPSYGWYPSIEHVEKIHGHEGKTIVKRVNNLKNVTRTQSYLWVLARHRHLIVDESPLVAEGFSFASGWIALLHFAAFTSVYWYRSLNDLVYVTGNKSCIITSLVDEYKIQKNHPVWLREKIFKT